MAKQIFEGGRCFNLIPRVLSYSSLLSELRRVGERTSWERCWALFLIKKMIKKIVNVLTVKRESQQISSLCNTSVRLKRKHSILSSDVNNLSRLQTSVSSKALIVFIFYRQVVISRTRSYILIGM